jgi:hypothetical protein
MTRFEDEETRRIMRAIAQQPETHFRDLMRRTKVAQNSLNPRLEKLKRTGYVREKRIGQQRQFHQTRKGYRATYEDAVQQGKEFSEFLRETAYGKQLLETVNWLEHEVIRLYLGYERERLDMIQRRLDYLANRGDKIEEIREVLQSVRNTYEKISQDSEKIHPEQTLNHLFQFGEEVIGYIRSLGLAIGADLILREEKDSSWLNLPDHLVSDVKKGLQKDKARALAVMQAIKNTQPQKKVTSE